MLKGCGEWCRLKDMFNIQFSLSSHDTVTLVMHIKDERIRNAALLRYTCGHDGRYFGFISFDSNGSPYSNKFKVGVLYCRISLRSKVR